MKKLVLNLESLRVSSFVTAADTPSRGTVMGRDSDTRPMPSGPSDYAACTYDGSCQGTCPILPITHGTV